MKKSTTSYILELEVFFTPSQRREVEARREVARVIYNTCLGRLLKRWRSVQGNPKWRTALRRVQEINAIGDPSADEMKERTALRKEMREVEKDFGLTEYELHAFVKGTFISTGAFPSTRHRSRRRGRFVHLRSTGTGTARKFGSFRREPRSPSRTSPTTSGCALSVRSSCGRICVPRLW